MGETEKKEKEKKGKKEKWEKINKYEQSAGGKGWEMEKMVQNRLLAGKKTEQGRIEGVGKSGYFRMNICYVSFLYVGGGSVAGWWRY